MDKNRIEGRYGTTSWHNTAKSSGLPVEVNAAVVQGSIAFLPGETCRERSGQESAEAIVVGVTSRSANEHNARVRGGTESRHDGKHVGAQGRASACPSRGLVPRPCGTAGYGPVCPVVWDPWLALVVSHGDPIRSLEFSLLCRGVWTNLVHVPHESE